jgi:putative phosphoesterase
MRIAILSDIHGNLSALEAVIGDLERQRPDLVVHGGDLVTRGTRPAEVLDVVRRQGWPGVLGNTDALLWRTGAMRRSEQMTADATAELLGTERVQWLQQLPLLWQQDSLLLLHATPDDLNRAPRLDAPDEDLERQYGSQGATLVVYGHIHRPGVRPLPGFTLANSGSVGQPYDGDWRASYLLVEDGRVEVRRVAYDLPRELSELARSHYPYAKQIAEMRRRGEYRPLPQGLPASVVRP